MSRFLSLAFGIVMVQPADIVKQQAFSAEGCKDADGATPAYHFLDVCENTLNNGTMYNFKKSVVGNKLGMEYYADEKCESKVPNTWSEFDQELGECKAAPGGTVKFFEKLTGKPYFRIEYYSQSDCAKSSWLGTMAQNTDGACENLPAGGSRRNVPNYKHHAAIARTFYSQKDCAGVPESQDFIEIGDECVPHPDPRAQQWMKGEAVDPGTTPEEIIDEMPLRVRAPIPVPTPVKNTHFFGVHDGHCAAGWIYGKNLMDVQAVEDCARHCYDSTTCGFFAYSRTLTKCVTYRAEQACPDDDQYPSYNAYYLDRTAFPEPHQVLTFI